MNILNTVLTLSNWHKHKPSPKNRLNRLRIPRSCSKIFTTTPTMMKMSILRTPLKELPNLLVLTNYLTQNNRRNVRKKRDTRTTSIMTRIMPRKESLHQRLVPKWPEDHPLFRNISIKTKRHKVSLLKDNMIKLRMKNVNRLKSTSLGVMRTNLKS